MSVAKDTQRRVALLDNLSRLHYRPYNENKTNKNGPVFCDRYFRSVVLRIFDRGISVENEIKINFITVITKYMHF